MNSSVETLNGLARKIKIEVPLETVQKAFDKAYKYIQRNATIKGFRKGKAPLTTIRTAYGDQVRQDVVQDLVSESYQSALDQHSLEPIGYPKINIEHFSEDKPLEFTAELEIRPPVQLKQVEGLRVEKEKLAVTDEQVRSILENIRRSHTDSTTVFEDRAAAEGDIAVIDFAGYMNGSPLDRGSAQGHQLELGAKQFLDGFEEGVIGMKISESRTLQLRFPDEYHDKAVAGQPVEFQVKLTGLKTKVLPELNDELAKKAGNFQSLQELEAAVRKDLFESEERRIRDDLKNRVVRALVECNPVEAPQSLVVQQKQALIEDMEKRMQQQGMKPDEFTQYRDKWDQEFSKTAEFMVRSTFLLDEIADKMNLKATKADITAKIDQFAKQSGIEHKKVEEFYGQSERRSRLAFQITEEKVVGYLIDKANIVEVDRKDLSDRGDEG